MIASIDRQLNKAGIASRPARREDARDIVDFVRSSFESDLLQCLIYCCPGADRFVEHQIESGGLGGDTIYVVATQHERPVGFAEMRILKRALVLNYICFRAEARSQGFGTLLLRDALKIAARAGRELVVLDVFQHNHLATGWYERLRFVPTGLSEWWSIKLDPALHHSEATLIGFPQAEASHAVFGFSQFELESIGGRYSVGRLGDAWFRLTQPAALGDLAIRAALATIDPNRRILAVLADGSLPESLRAASRLLARTVRMEHPFGELMDRLDAFEVPDDERR